MTDLALAIGHHILVFGLVAMMMATRVLLGQAPVNAEKLARIDAMTGLVSGLVLVVGLLRVFLGGKGWAFYQENPFFWAKVATFVLIGLLSIGPTISFLRWNRARKADTAFQPEAGEVAAARRALGFMALLVVPLVGFAAAMARWPF